MRYINLRFTYLLTYLVLQNVGMRSAYVYTARRWPTTRLKYRLYNYPSRVLSRSAANNIIWRAFQVLFIGGVYQ